MTGIPQRVGVYCRLSYLDDGTEERVERQEADCRELARRLSWPISEAHIFKDPGRSAWRRDRKRPDWDALLRAIGAGEIDGVIVYHGDRLIRQPRDLEDLLDIAREKRVKLASPSGTRDLGNSDDQFILRIEAAQACKASDDSSRRIKRAHKARVEKGLPRPGGTRAFGFERDNITIRESEARVLREAAERLLAGETMYSVMRWANEVSTTSTGGRWRVNTLRDALERPRIAGLLDHGGHLVEGAWEPILRRETWEDLRAVLRARGDKYSLYVPVAGPGASVRYLLTGIARCGTCGGSMRVQAGVNAGGKRRRTYLCGASGCPYRVGRSVPHVDAYVEGRALKRLNDEEFINGLLASDEKPELVSEIAELERRKADVEHQLADLADHPNLRPELLVQALESFDRKIGELRDRLASGARQRLLAKMVGITRERWTATPLDVRRATVAALFTVTILRTRRGGQGFDPKSVKLTPVKN